jgi:hypothetical protein
MQAMTGVSEMAQKLMSTCEGAMTTMGCVDTGSGAHDKASAAFEEASSQLEELGFEYEITSDGVFFSRSDDTAVEEYGPATRIGAAPFLGLTGAVELGSLDPVIGVSDYKGLHRCPVLLVCPKSKVKGAKSTYAYYKFCANPSKFHVNARHFCGVHKLTWFAIMTTPARVGNSPTPLSDDPSRLSCLPMRCTPSR